MKKPTLTMMIASISLLALSCFDTFGATDHQTTSSTNNSLTNSVHDTALLAKLSARRNAIQSLQGHFVQQKHIAVLPVPLSSTGTFEFDQAQGVIWKTLTPVRNLVHLTADGIRFEDENGQSQHAAGQPEGAEVVAEIFMGVITGELDGLANYFSVVATGSEKQWTLRLSPHSANLAAYIQSIELQGGEFTEQLDIAETNGDKTHIEFTTDKVVRKAE